MLKQIVAGSLITIVSIAIHSGFISAAIPMLMRHHRRPLVAMGVSTSTSSLILTVIWLLIAHSASIWLWSLSYLVLGVFDALEPAVYFSLVTFTTVGFGDITLTEEWRILSGMTAVNGLLLFGFSTAFLFEVFSRFKTAEGV